MLYKKNSAACVSDELFKNPTAEYRCTPFWAWNGELNPDLLKKEIEYMKEMGFGGFHMHPRVGMSTEYLSDKFMDLIRTCINKAKDEDMLAYLYDEDKWPSGFAGGYNTKEIENRQKALYFTKKPYNDGTLTVKEDIENSKDDIPKSKYYLLAAYDIEQDSEGSIITYKRIDKDTKAEHTKWFAYVEYATPSAWHNGQAYCDTLQKSVIESFVRITHERYKECVGDEFDKTVPSIFTDEPQFRRKMLFNTPFDEKAAALPYTTDFDDTFKAAYGYSIVDRLPEVLFELKDKPLSDARYNYHDHISERFACAFSDTIGKWCDENGISLTGHMMQEPTLRSQTDSIGDCMRSYRGFQIPGIDMLCDGRELTTAKQCQSAVHQYGREGMVSELYGVTNWTFDFKGHKLQGDWQAALGVTVRVPHLFWYTMRGEAKRDYPAAIGYQSPWYKEYKYVEDHFARVNTLMTRGTPDVNVAVVHPVESYWMVAGPFSQTCLRRKDLEDKFLQGIDWMLRSTIDFDYLCESTLPAQYKGVKDGLEIGCMKYKAVIVPNMLTIRSSTLSILEKFYAAGGKVIFMGKIPEYVDAKPSGAAKEFAKKCTNIQWSIDELNNVLEPNRDISIMFDHGNKSENLIYQLRKDGDGKNLFICHVDRPRNEDVEWPDTYFITIKGEWKVKKYDTTDGSISDVKAKYKDGNTVVMWECCTYDSLLLRLEPGRNEEGKILGFPNIKSRIYLDHSAAYTLEEKNVLVLDYPKYSINGGEVNGPEEILKADDKIRDFFGIRHRDGGMVQPWVACADKNPKDKVTLYYEFDSDIAYSGAELALESIQYASVKFNGKPVAMTETGYYVDIDSIKKIALPDIVCGKNVLEVTYMFGDITQLEAMYVLGDFGVSNIGTYAKIIPLPEKLYFDDITKQGFAFYGGNITYHMEAETEDSCIFCVDKFRGSAVTVDVDGKRAGIIAYTPHILKIEGIGKGKHKIDFTLLGNRYNTFGQFHKTDEKMSWAGPGAWRTRGKGFCYERLLERTGILSTPVIYTEE